MWIWAPKSVSVIFPDIHRPSFVFSPAQPLNEWVRTTAFYTRMMYYFLKNFIMSALVSSLLYTKTSGSMPHSDPHLFKAPLSLLTGCLFKHVLFPIQNVAQYMYRKAHVQSANTVLTRLCQLDRSETHLGRGSSNWENTSIRLTCNCNCSSLIIDRGVVALLGRRSLSWISYVSKPWGASW